MEPEDVIFNRKAAMARRLLKITIAELRNAPKQEWYEEYIALLAIRLEPARSTEIVAELMTWYGKKVRWNEREFAILGVIQFMEPTKLTVPFNQHLWHKTLINDVRAVFLNQFPSVNYYDEEISEYWLSRQALWKTSERKIRVVFLVHSNITCDKVLPVYEAMKRREEFEPYIVIHPDLNSQNGDAAWKYFYLRYPNDTIYDYLGLMDIRKLKPDYVFFTNPYVRHRPFPSIRTNDIVRFAKICIISYGASLAYVFPNRLFSEYRHVYKNVYMLFASAETVKTITKEHFAEDITRGYKHVEFLGYPALKDYYRLEKEPSAMTRILWTPRWLVDDKWGGSHFMEYKDKFISLRDKYGERAELYFRPHMNLFSELLEKNIMTREEIKAYKKELQDKGIIQHNRLADMNKSIRNIDIFLADYSSILVCLFLTCRPIIYCEFGNAEIFPEYKEMFSAMYVARSWEEVEHYLDELMVGNDPLSERRQEIAAKIYETHKYASEKILDRLIKDFKQTMERCDFGT